MPPKTKDCEAPLKAACVSEFGGVAVGVLWSAFHFPPEQVLKGNCKGFGCCGVKKKENEIFVFRNVTTFEPLTIQFFSIKNLSVITGGRRVVVKRAKA